MAPPLRVEYGTAPTGGAWRRPYELTFKHPTYKYNPCIMSFMKYRKFGQDDIAISEVGLGCWQIGSADWGEVSASETESILEESLANGVTFYDTADVYGMGRSEKFVGDFIRKHKKHSDELFIATKVGRDPNLYPDGYSRESVTHCIENSLQRLGLESLDLVQTHCVPPEVMRDGEIYEWLRLLKKDGKIKRFGASVESMEEAMLCMEYDDMYSLQIIFNVMRQKALEEVLPVAKQKNVGIIVRLPLNSGLLSGKYTIDTKFGEKDHRNFNRDGKHFNVGETFGGLPYEKGLELVEELREYLPQGVSMAQSALRWCLDQAGVSVVIPGASKVAQATSNASVSELPSFSQDELEKINSFYKDKVHSHIRGLY